MEQLEFYSLRRNMKLEMDHKSLNTIFRDRFKPNVRLDRWMFEIQLFKFMVCQVKG